MNDPNGINYPDDPELRRKLAREIEKLQMQPSRRKTVEAAKHWPKYAAAVVKRLQEKMKENK